jgi:acetylglutamate kinase
LTDVAGVLDADKELIREMSAHDARALIKSGVASGGMIPKLETCIAARAAGVEAAVILDGRQPHALLMELFTEHGAGTLIR